MTTINATVRNGQIELPHPLDLPDGTRLTIPIPGLSLGFPDEGWSDTPGAIENWVRWYDAVEPVEFTSEERAAWQAARAEQKGHALEASCDEI